MTNRNRLFPLLLILLAALFLAACGSSQPAANPPDQPAGFEDEWARIEAEGKMIVGTSADYPPFAYYTPEFRMDGFDIALMRDIADLLGVEVEFMDMAFDGLGGALQLGQIDAAIAAISVTPQRATQVDFTDIYFVGEDAVLANGDADIDIITSVEDVAGMKIGVQTGSVYDDWVQENLVATGVIEGTDLFAYPTIDQALQDLSLGRIDLVVMDAQPAASFVKHYDGKLKLVDATGETLLSFVPYAETPLVGTEWLLAGQVDANGQFQRVLDETAITAFFEGGSLTGTAGCNSYTAPYEVNGQDLTVGAAVATRQSCAQPEGIMEQEQQYLDQLGAVASYNIDGTGLELLDAAGQRVMFFYARPKFDINNIIWVLESYGPTGDPQTVLPDSQVTLEIAEDGQLSGSAGCNQYNGRATVSDSSIIIELGGTTRQICEEPVNQQENAYLAALETADIVAIDKGQLLIFYDNGQQVLRFAPVKKDPLAGTSWKLAAFGEVGEGDVPIADTKITIAFSYGGRAVGSTGCNNYNTTYEIDGESLTFSPIAATLKACSDPISQQEQTYLAALQATASYDIVGVKSVGRGISEQFYAVAVKQGNDAVRDHLNVALAELKRSGRLEELAREYLHLEPEEIVPPPTPVPPVTCTNGMAWVADLTYDDHGMTNPPVLQPGESFTKVWRVRNIGTCTWDSSYYLDYVGGNTSAARMGGERTYIAGQVAPGATYDLAVDLIAPPKPGVYQGFWQMFSGQAVGFGPKIWVGIRVPAAATPTPAPTSTPSPEVRFSADRTQIKEGECTTLRWDVKNVQAVYLYPQGEDWRDYGVAGQGARKVCPTDTTTYLLRVAYPDGTVEEWPLTINVTPAANAPEIQYFLADPPHVIAVGECVTLSWSVGGDVNEVSVSRNNVSLWDGAPVRGSIDDCPPGTGTMTYNLTAAGPGGTSRAVQYIDVVSPEATPTPTLPPPPTPTEAPPTDTPVPPAPTEIPPTETPLPPPTETPLPPPTETPVPPPTDTPVPPPTETPAPLPTDTPVPPPTEEPPTATPESPQPTPVPDIVGNWILVSFVEGKAAPIPVLEGTQITASFTIDGRVSGSAGCNTYNSTYLAEGDSLTIGPIGSSQLICGEPQGIMEQEQQYLTTLSAATNYVVNGTQLQITQGGKHSLIYQAAP